MNTISLPSWLEGHGFTHDPRENAWRLQTEVFEILITQDRGTMPSWSAQLALSDAADCTSQVLNVHTPEELLDGLAHDLRWLANRLAEYATQAHDAADHTERGQFSPIALPSA